MGRITKKIKEWFASNCGGSCAITQRVDNLIDAGYVCPNCHKRYYGPTHFEMNGKQVWYACDCDYWAKVYSLSLENVKIKDKQWAE